MKDNYKLYLRHFILSFIGFGIIYWAFELFEISKPLAIRLLIKSAIVAFIFSGLTVYNYIKKLRKNGLSTDDDNLKVKHNNVVMCQKSSEEILMKITQNADFKKMKIHKTKSGYKIYTNYSWGSWGEVIDINIENRNSENQQIEISSRPKFPLTLIDYGKNKENVETITALIKNVA